MHAGPGAESAGTDDGRAVRRFKPERRVGRLRQAGQTGKSFRSYKVSLVFELHGADDGSQVHVAAAFAGSDDGALNLHCAGQDGGARIGDAEAAVGVAMEAESGIGILPCQAADDHRHFFRICAAGGVADDDAADLLAGALRGHLVEVVESLLPETRFAGTAVFPPAATGVHGVFQVHNHFQTALLKVLNGLIGHAQILFRRGLQRHLNIEQPGFDDDNGRWNAAFVGGHELRVWPILNPRAAAARSAEQSQLHRAGVGGVESAGQVADKLVCAGEADFGVVDAEGGHVLQQADGIRHGDVDLRLLHPVPKACIEDLDLSGFRFLHLSLRLVVKIFFAEDGLHPGFRFCAVCLLAFA